jgi:hypothetical protein
LLGRLADAWTAPSQRRFRRIPNTAVTEVCAGLGNLRHFASHAEPQAGFTSSHWLVTNESAGGLALRSAPGTQPSVRSGEIIGLRGDGEHAWRIATVRWVRSPRPGRVELGAQLLAPTAEAAGIRPASGGTRASFLPALLLPEIPLIHQPRTIVAPRGTFQPLRDLVLEHNGQPRAIRAIRLMEFSPWFERFQFSEA